MLKKILSPLTYLWRKFRKLSKKKKAAIIILLLVVFWIINGVVNKPDPKAQYQTEIAKLASITEKISETGHITTAGVAPVYSTTTGIVEEVYVKNSDYVAKNAPLFKVKATATKQQKDAAYATYMQARAAVDAAKAQQLALQAQMFTQWNEFKELAETDRYQNQELEPIEPNRNVPEFQIPQKEWLSAETAYKNQEQVVAQATANLSAAWQAYQSTQDSTVTAILAGQIQNLAVTKGDLIEVVNSPNSHPALVLVQENVETTIRLSISETDIIKVKPGMEAEVELEAIKDKLFKAVVDRVDTIALPSAGVVEYSVYLNLIDTDQAILAGMTADVDIIVAQTDNVLTVPSSAVKPYEGGRAVRVLNEQYQIEFIPVETGISGDGLVQILSGIEEGTEVVTALTNDLVSRSGPGFF